jgi:hypothetical protein
MAETWFVKHLVVLSFLSHLMFSCKRGSNLINSIPLQGLAFQLIDDVLDFTGTSASLGKGSLSDIRHVMTALFLLYLFAMSII